MPSLTQYGHNGQGRTGGTIANFGATKGDVVAGRYKVLSEAGAGNFARVVKCVDMEDNDRVVAVKILRKEFQKDAQFEKAILDSINAHDPRNEFKICKMSSHFLWGDLPCFVFQLLGRSLKTCRFGPTSVTEKDLAAFTKQACRTLAFLHFTCKMIHTDLKPENILLDKDTDGEVQGIGSGWSICDLGSASFFSEKPDEDLIQTRPYRAPEVVLGSPWSYAVDMWSIGCILYELKKGRKLFDPMNDEQHLMMFEKKIGKLPAWLVKNANPRVRRSYFDARDNLVHSQSVFSKPYGNSCPMKHLEEEFADEPDFLDFLMQCFHYDPVCRMRADEAAHHPWVLKHFATQAKLIQKLPNSGYTSRVIATPGTHQIQNNMPLSDEQKAAVNQTIPTRVAGQDFGVANNEVMRSDRAAAVIHNHASASVHPHLLPAAGMPSVGRLAGPLARGPLAAPLQRPVPPMPPTERYQTSSSAYGSNMRHAAYANRSIPAPSVPPRLTPPNFC